MIAIFTVLGLLLFGGGAWAIYDGWPYLVLERGFTEVIIGSIASGTGLIMLSLAWLLKQVGSLRQALAEAVVARPEAALPATPSQSDAPSPSAAHAVAPAAIGAAAGAVAAEAVAEALAVPEAESAPEPEAAPSEDRDLFGKLVARSLEEPAAESEPAPAPVEAAEPLPDMFDEPPSVPEPVQRFVEVEAEEYEPAGPVAGTIASSDTEEEAPPPDEPAAPAGGGDDFDEFSALRQSLAGHLDEPERESGRVEPSFSAEPDPFAAAEAWMDRASPRREPWLEAPPADEPAPAEAPPPPWPPRTEAHAFDVPAEEPVAQPVSDQAAEPVEETPETGIEEAPAETVAEPEAEEAAAAAPAASDEGVIGAYQVGDAHFTLYADGSIRARTPDGEYSFVSMDELKVYLASEKSRLGV